MNFSRARTFATGANGKRDANEGAIADALERAGCLVAHVQGVDVPDLLVFSPYNDADGKQRGYVLLEVKVKKGKLSKGQQAFREKWPNVFTVRTIQEAHAYACVPQDLR